MSEVSPIQTACRLWVFVLGLSSTILLLVAAGSSLGHSISDAEYLANTPLVANATMDVNVDTFAANGTTFVGYVTPGGGIILSRLSMEDGNTTTVRSVSAGSGHYPRLSGDLNGTVCVSSWSTETPNSTWAGYLTVFCTDESLVPSWFATVALENLTEGAVTVKYYEVAQISPDEVVLIVGLLGTPTPTLWSASLAVVSKQGQTWNIPLKSTEGWGPPVQMIVRNGIVWGFFSNSVISGGSQSSREPELMAFRIDLANHTLIGPQSITTPASPGNLSAVARSISVDWGSIGEDIVQLYLQVIEVDPGGVPTISAYQGARAITLDRLLRVVDYRDYHMDIPFSGRPEWCPNIADHDGGFWPPSSVSPVVFIPSCRYDLFDPSSTGGVWVVLGADAQHLNLTVPTRDLRVNWEQNNAARLIYIEPTTGNVYWAILRLAIPDLTLAFREEPPRTGVTSERIELNVSISNIGRSVSVGSRIEVLDERSGAVIGSYPVGTVDSNASMAITIEVLPKTGTNTFTVRIVGAMPADLPGGTKELRFTLSDVSAPPFLGVSDPLKGQCIGGVVRIAGSVFDPDGEGSYVLRYHVIGMDWHEAEVQTEWIILWDLAGIPPGDNRIEVVASDGLWTSNAAVIPVVVNNLDHEGCSRLVITSFSPTLNFSVSEGENFSLRVTAWSLFARTIQYEWQCDCVYDPATSEPQLDASTNFSSSGIRTAEVVIIAGSDVAIVRWNITVLEVRNNTAPVVMVETSGEPYVGDEIFVNGSSSFDPDGDPMSFHWYVDGIPLDSDAATIQLRFGTPGNHTLRLDISDGEEMSSYRQEIPIGPHPRPFTSDSGSLWFGLMLVALGVLVTVIPFVLRRRRTKP